jgi:type IV secretory pathway VirB2 component (pilin)
VKLSNVIKSHFIAARGAIARNKAACAAADQKFLAVFGLVVASALAMAPDVAMAAPWDGAANQILAALTGGLSRTIAIIAVIVVGLMAMFGKLSFDACLKVVAGVILVFGSAAVVDYFIAAAS